MYNYKSRQSYIPVSSTSEKNILSWSNKQKIYHIGDINDGTEHYLSRVSHSLRNTNYKISFLSMFWLIKGLNIRNLVQKLENAYFERKIVDADDNR